MMRLSLGTMIVALLFSGCGMPAPGTEIGGKVAFGDAAHVRALVAQGADPDEMDEHGLTPLIGAARSGDLAVIDALLQAGANPDQADRFVNGWTPLMHAIHKGQLEAARHLLDAGADVNARAWGRVTALLLASGECRDDIVRLLLDRGADPAARSDSGATPLMNALAGAHEQNVRALLARDPDLELGEGFGARVAVVMAHVRGRSDLADLATHRR